jgi:lambda family phage portal protein
LQLGFSADEVNEVIESRWNEWASEVCLAEKLHTMSLSKVIDGEAFALFISRADDPNFYNSVKLDIKPIECDQVTTPGGMYSFAKTNWVDGILFDQWGNPETYHVLKEHPGDMFAWAGEAENIRAQNVLHWFRGDRPQQARGIPEITPALPLFAQLRRYTLAVIEAAETAADFACVIQTDSMPDSDSAPSGQYGTAFETMEIDKGMMITAPAGYRMAQFQPTQPTAMHDTFCKTILKEIFHCLNMPYAVGSGDYADDSYSSGRLGKQTYMRGVKVQRSHMNYKLLDRIFAAWLDQAVMIPGYLPRMPSDSIREIPHQWFFRDDVFVDPLKDAEADAAELLNNTTTLAEKCAERGLDYRSVIKQRAKEVAELKAAGLVVEPAPMPTEEVPA